MWHKIKHALYHKKTKEGVTVHKILGTPVIFTSNYKKSVLIFLLLSLAEIIFLLCIPDIKTRYILITSFTLIFLSFFATGWMFSTFYFLTGIMLITDYHLLRLYKESFQSLAQQILSVVFDTNTGEIISYFRIFSKTEIFMIVFLLSSSLFFLFIRKKMKLKYIVFLILLFGIFCGYGHVFIKEIKKFKEPSKIIYLARKNDDFKWNAVASEQSPQNVIILIGESHRYDYFNKKWNNFMPENTILMSDAISQFGFTLHAMPQILSRKTVYDKAKFFHESSVFKLFEEAGYETYYLSYLKQQHAGDTTINSITFESQNFQQYGAWRKGYTPIKRSDGTPDDFVDDGEIVPIIKDILNKNSNKKLIVIKTIGCHYNFEDRYPNSFDKNKPSLKTERKGLTEENKQIILRTYENAMDYSVYVIKNLLTEIQNQDQSTLLVFSSDHAINIFDKHQWFVANVPQSYHIPLFWYANDTFLKVAKNKKLWQQLEKQKDKPVISNYIPETIATLSSISHAHYNPKMDIFVNDEKFTKKRPVIWSNETEHFYEDMK